MKNRIFVLIFFLFAQTIYAMGFGDWSYVTSNGSQLYDPGDGVYLSVNHTNTDLYNLTEWYFYKNHIIGEYRPDINDDLETGYFILNELNGDLKTYNDKDLFENALRTQSLIPIFWTRWYPNHFSFLHALYILWLFYSPILTGLTLFICLCIFGAFAFKNKILKIVCIAITVILLLPPILFMLNDYFTSSI